MASNSASSPSRRSFLGTTGGFAVAAIVGSPSRSRAAPAAAIDEIEIISRQPQYYHGWPTLFRRRNGQLILVYSGGREGHVCPFGRVDMMTSRDDGATWTWPRTILDTDLDDRDAGVVETASGSLIVTTFTSLAYEGPLKAMEEAKPTAPAAVARLSAWKAARDRLSAAERRDQLGVWAVRSTDGGISWSPQSRSGVSSPHGPIALKDGRLLYLGKELWSEEKRVGACESTDDGATWRWLAEIPTRSGDNASSGYHELHAAEADDGTIVAQIRNHNPANSGETLQTESSDGGRTWSEPHGIGVWGLPSHLLKLNDGRLLMTYGHRRAPFGNQARLSENRGRDWSDPLPISADGAGSDLGYPSTAELGDGSLLTVWYESMRGSRFAVLRQARWKLAR